MGGFVWIGVLRVVCFYDLRMYCGVFRFVVWSFHIVVLWSIWDAWLQIWAQVGSAAALQAPGHFKSHSMGHSFLKLGSMRHPLLRASGARHLLL